MSKYKAEDIIERFKHVGSALYQRGLENSHSGNLSVKVGDRLLITRRGSQLGFLEESDIVETGLEKDDSGIALASSEVGVHRAIYKETNALAVVHSHQIAATALSFIQDEIIPIDVEGGYILRKIPIVSVKEGSGSKEMEEKIPQALKDYQIVMLKGHGAFAIGDHLEEAWHYTETLQNVANIIFMAKLMGADVQELEQRDFDSW
jgi:L-fuculose-phosphate aldolase